MNTYIALSSMSLDLKRCAIGYHRGSTAMAQKFSEEAVKRGKDINPNYLKPYLKRLLAEVKSLDRIEDNQAKAEKALLLSILFQNAALNISR